MKSIVSTLFLLFLIQSANTGPLYYPACYATCEIVCFVGGIIVPTLGAICFAAANSGGCGAACLVACFSDTNTFVVKNGNTTLTKISSEIKIGDFIQTIENNTCIWTKVVSNKVHNSNNTFQFVNIYTSNNNNISITNDHVMIILKNSIKILVKAIDLRIGDVLVTNDGNTKIKNIKYTNDNVKYEIITESGTVLASSILTTTLCVDELSNNLVDADQKLNEWKLRHKF